MKPVVVIGIGNPLRRDDGLGWEVVASLAADLQASPVDLLTCHQLLPEHVDLAANAGMVIFVDARAEGRPGEVRWERVVPAATRPTEFSHDYGPERVVGYARDLYNKTPEALLVSVSAEDFGIGEGMSGTVSAVIPIVSDGIRRILRTWEAESRMVIPCMSTELQKIS